MLTQRSCRLGSTEARRVLTGRSRWRRLLDRSAYSLALVGQVGIAAAGFPDFSVADAPAYLEAVFKELEMQAGTNADTLFVEATSLSQLGRKDAAERLTRRALAEAPGRADLHAFLAGLFIRQDRLKEAAECLREALRIEPALPGARRQLGMALDRLGEHAQAREAFAAAVRQDPSDATARLLLGRWLLDQDEIQAALEELREACRLDPSSPNAHYALFRAQAADGQTADSRATLDTFKQLRATDKATSDARLEMFDNEQQMRDLAAVFHIAAARLLLRQGKPQLAETHLRQAFRVNPDAIQAREMLGNLLLRQKRLREARPVWEALVESRPEQAAYRVNLGTLLLQLKEYPQAEKAFKAVLDLDPDQPEALNNLVRFYLVSQRDVPTALKMSQRLSELRPTAANFDLLAWAWYANGHLREAIAAAAQAVEQEPENIVYRERHRRLTQQQGITE